MDSASITERILRFLPPVLMAIAAQGCDETLPPRIEPAEILRARIDASSALLVIVDSMTVSRGGRNLTVQLDNLYEDVLDGPARVRGDIRVWLLHRSDVQKTFQWTEADLLTPWVVRGSTATLGIDSAAVLASFWDHRTDQGEPFWNYTSFRRMSTVGGIVYYLSDSVYFEAEGSMQLFRDVQSLKAPPIRFAVVYQIWRVSPP